MNQITGTVARVVTDRGFAFVRSGDTDYFLHHSEFDGEFNRLTQGTVISFTPINGPKGPRCAQAEVKR